MWTHALVAPRRLERREHPKPTHDTLLPGEAIVELLAGAPTALHDMERMAPGGHLGGIERASGMVTGGGHVPKKGVVMRRARSGGPLTGHWALSLPKEGH